MTEKELFERNQEIASEFSRFVLANPETSKILPPDSEIVFLVDSDPELTEHNIELAETIKKEGSNVVFVHIKSILPKETCRLVEPRVELSLK